MADAKPTPEREPRPGIAINLGPQLYDQLLAAAAAKRVSVEQFSVDLVRAAVARPAPKPKS